MGQLPPHEVTRLLANQLGVKNLEQVVGITIELSTDDFPLMTVTYRIQSEDGAIGLTGETPEAQDIALSNVQYRLTVVDVQDDEVTGWSKPPTRDQPPG